MTIRKFIGEPKEVQAIFYDGTNVEEVLKILMLDNSIYTSMHIDKYHWNEPKYDLEICFKYNDKSLKLSPNNYLYYEDGKFTVISHLRHIEKEYKELK